MTNHTRANESILADIHRMTAEAFHRMITEGKRVVTKDGEIEVVDLTAADWKVITTFLKENNITALPEAGSALGELARSVSELPALPDGVDEVVVPLKRSQKPADGLEGLGLPTPMKPPRGPSAGF